MNKKPPYQAFGPAINRIADIMAHSNLYAFKGVSRLAEDARVSTSTLSRIINGEVLPSIFMVERVRKALELELGIELDTRDLIAEYGAFKTASVCEAVGCAGCLPASAIDQFGRLKPAFQGVLPGTWVTSKYPNGYQPFEDKEVK